jgi:hypothetical protein
MARRTRLKKIPPLRYHEEEMSLLDKLFVSLRVLSKLPEGGRICTTGTGQIKIEDTNSLGGWIATGRRRITGDSRDEAVKVLMQIINDVSELSDNIIDSIRNYGNDNTAPIGHVNENTKKCQTLEKICNMLKSSKKGIVNLHSTYSDDANITAKLEEIMEKMDSQHTRITEVLSYVRIVPRNTAPIAIQKPEVAQQRPPSTGFIRYHQSPPVITDNNNNDTPQPNQLPEHQPQAHQSGSIDDSSDEGFDPFED